MSVLCTASDIEQSPTRTLETPFSLSIPNMLFILGFRMSQSNSSTLLPVLAIMTARFAAEMVLPSPSMALTIKMLLGCERVEENKILVLMPR